MAKFVRSARLIASLTVVSRILGLVRDSVIAGVFGVTGTIVTSAYAVAFWLPNVFRGLLGEGALSAAFIPTFTDYLEAGDRKKANRFLSATLVMLVVVLGIIVAAGVGALVIGSVWAEEGGKWQLTFSLAAVMLPFALLVCVVAFLGAALQCRGHFATPALAPVVLNLCIIGGAIWVARILGGPAERQIFAVAIMVVAAGAVQIVMLIPAMRRQGLMVRPVWEPANPGLRRVKALLVPAALALGIVQLNSGLDRIIAMFLMPAGAAESFTLFGRQIQYPLSMGAPAVLYYGSRLYNFPLGVFGIALATAIFPLFSRLAVRKEPREFAKAVSHGLRLALFIGIPSSVGLILIREPFISLWVSYGKVASEAETVARIGSVVVFYSLGVWAYCTIHILTRAFYALEDIATPRRVAMYAAGANLVLNLILVWFLREGGLALATAVCAMAQVFILSAMLRGRVGGLRGREILASVARTVIATVFMSAACWFGISHLGPAVVKSAGAARRAAELGGGLLLGALAFVLVAAVLKMPELKEILSLRKKEKKTPAE
ncbi:MAG: murein biosynthesis integral membrane protein MurJ [Planctomycetia bacterium]|nr:murein biosynthesis integral membrane protein MurJ [Planctomycetia bacterium]